ncbi:helicase-associated domain-containing protein [Rhodococcus sp. NPDC060086]|uniref:helicase-associated domain-containing protein n=1 Tax=Rhodococcus sp. NPDC060086 TaxID=3347055 RepID=UPI00365F0964
MTMDGSETLRAYVESLDEVALATVLRRRPDVLDLPWPAHLTEVTARLGSTESIVTAYRRLPLPYLEVLGALTLQRRLEQSQTVESTARWLDADPTMITDILADLRDVALAWTGPTGVIDTAAEFPVLAEPLGRPIRENLDDATVAQLQALAKTLGLAASGRKTELVERFVSFFRDSDAVRRLVESAPAEEQALLAECAATGSPLEYFRIMFGSLAGARRNAPSRPGEWAVSAGLMWHAPYDGVAVMPLEVTLALRGSQWRLPFHPEQPPVEGRPVPADHSDTEAVAHLLRQIERISALLDLADQQIPLLKSGTVGVRTLRGIAKDWSADVDEVSLALASAIDIGVLAPAAPPAAPKTRSRKAPPSLPSPGLEPGPAASAWRAAQPGIQGVSVLQRWWESDDSALTERKLVGELGDTSVYRHLRHDVLQLHCELPAGHGVDVEQVIAAVKWRNPLVDPDIFTALVTPVMREASLLGVLALGTATPLARALLADRVDEAVDALFAEAHTSAVFGADLTAVVFGPPATDLARLLDGVADRESRGAATTWRFSPGSIRAAFDRGATAEEVVDRLAAVAQSDLPQGLEYLISDVARTHGQVGVVEFGCAIVADDPTLLLEVIGNRALVKVGLSALAPTVVASRSDAQTTLAALRGAGYAPVLRAADGTVTVRSAPVEPTTRSDTGPVSPGTASDLVGSASRRVPDADPEQQARHLLATTGQEPVVRSHNIYQFFTALRGRGDQTSLLHLASGRPVHITAGDRDGLFHSAVLRGSTLTVWNVEAERYEDLRVDEIRVGR